MSWPLPLIFVPLLIALNAFFVAAEYAVVAIRGSGIEALRQKGRRRTADAMEQLKRHVASSIASIQVCITATNLLLGWLGEPAMKGVLLWLLGPLGQRIPSAIFTPVSIALAFFVVTLATVVFSELLPKALTLRYVQLAARLTAVPMLMIRNAVQPLVWLMNTMASLVTRPLGLGRVDQMEEERVSAEELRLLTTEAARDGVLTTRERSLILNTLSLGNRAARRIMVPRVRVSFLDLRWSMDENRRIINQRLYSRLPLCDGGMDHVVGLLHTKEFLTAYNAAGDTAVLSLIARPPVFAPENTPTDRLLTIFHDRHTQMVILIDEYGGVEGIVTLRDVIDELLGVVDQSLTMTAQGLQGDLEDASAGPRRFTIAGDMPLHELAQHLDCREWCAHESASTVSGLIQDRLGHVPVAGETVEVDGTRLRVIEATLRAVVKVEVTLV